MLESAGITYSGLLVSRGNFSVAIATYLQTPVLGGRKGKGFEDRRAPIAASWHLLAPTVMCQDPALSPAAPLALPLFRAEPSAPDLGLTLASCWNFSAGTLWHCFTGAVPGWERLSAGSVTHPRSSV